MAAVTSLPWWLSFHCKNPAHPPPTRSTSSELRFAFRSPKTFKVPEKTKTEWVSEWINGKTASLSSLGKDSVVPHLTWARHEACPISFPAFHLRSKTLSLGSFPDGHMTYSKSKGFRKRSICCGYVTDAENLKDKKKRSQQYLQVKLNLRRLIQ